MNRHLLILFFGILGIFCKPLLAQTPSLVICKGSSVNYKEFNDPGSLPSVAWAWKFDGANPGSSTDREPQNINYPDTGLFKTECTSTFNNGTKSTKAVYVLVIWGNPEPIPMKDTVLCNPAVSMVLNAGNNHRGWNYHWTSTDVNLNGIDTTKQTLSIKKAGTYSVKVYSKCATISKTINVRIGEFGVTPDKALVVARHVNLYIIDVICFTVEHTTTKLLSVCIGKLHVSSIRAPAIPGKLTAPTYTAFCG